MFIAIVGGSASGKTKVSKLISDFYKNSVIISMDNFYRKLTQEEKNNITEYNFDIPSSFDMEHFYSCLFQLKQGNEIKIPIYDFKTHSRTEETILVCPKKIIIVEGIFVLEDKRIRDLFDIKVFVDATPEIRLSRRIARDIKERGRNIDCIIEQYNKFVQPSYEKYIRPVQRYVDIIIPNNTNNSFIGVDILIYAIHYKLNNELKNSK